MINWKRILAVLAALAFVAGISAPALAGQVLCKPQGAGIGPMSAVIGGPTSSVPSGTLYILNSDGCAGISNADLGYFKSQGFYPGANFFSVSATGVAAQTTAANSPVLPAGAAIQSIVVQNTTANALTGGLDIGVAGSSDQTIVAAYAVGANALILIPSASILRFTFGPSGAASGTPTAQPIYLNAHTSWNSGSINVTIFYSLYIPF